MSTDTSKYNQLAEVLGFVAEALDVPEELFQKAKRRYDDLAEWIKADHLAHFRSDAEIYPQGSIRLGTSIRPVRSEDDYDVDLVYRREIRKTNITQDQLKTDVGEQLRRYVQYLRGTDEQVPNLVEGSRCWTLKYDGLFHLDILPALPDDEAGGHNLRDREDGILITDKKQRAWQHSNPKGYARWFDKQQEGVLLERRGALAKEANVDVASIPTNRVPTPLRKAVQILKRHRDIRHQGNHEDKPISIVITTLAARAYEHEAGDSAALMAAVLGMRGVLEGDQRDGVYWVENPTSPEENFADKWQEKPQRAESFFGWLDRLELDFREASQQVGLHDVGERLSTVLGEDVVRRGVEKYGRTIDGRQQQGRLHMAPQSGLLGTTGAQVKKNTWYGG